MAPCIIVRVGFALLLGIAAAAAQQPLETRGAWGLIPDGEDFAVRTAALGGTEGTLSLYCRKEQQVYALEIKSPALAATPRGEDIRISFKIDDDDQTWFNLATGPDGTVPISHQTPFWIIFTALKRNPARAVAFTAGDQSWQFTLDGLTDIIASLSVRCGFEPAPPQPRGPAAAPSR